MLNIPKNMVGAMFPALKDGLRNNKFSFNPYRLGSRDMLTLTAYIMPASKPVKTTRDARKIAILVVRERLCP